MSVNENVIILRSFHKLPDFEAGEEVVQDQRVANLSGFEYNLSFW